MKCEQISLKFRSGIFKSSAKTNEVKKNEQKSFAICVISRIQGNEY